MTAIKINARDVVVEIEKAGSPATWVEIAGLTSVEMDPSEGEEVVDTTTYASAGHAEQEKMQIGAKLTIEGFYIADDATGEQDEGQALVEELHGKLGYESLGRIRFRHLLSDEWKIWRCTASLSAQGGENNDKTSWGAEFVRSGAPTTAPVAP